LTTYIVDVPLSVPLLAHAVWQPTCWRLRDWLSCSRLAEGRHTKVEVERKEGGRDARRNALSTRAACLEKSVLVYTATGYGEHLALAQHMPY